MASCPSRPNGNKTGTGIVWANIPLNADAEAAVVSGVLRAFDASNLGAELYDTQQNPTRDSSGLYSKYTPPTVANGKVYLATFSNKLRVYGLLASQAASPKGSLTGTSSTATGAVNLTSTGTADWAHWPGYVHKATGGSQITDITAIYPPYPVTTYTTDQRTYSWTDGTPTATGSVTTGVYAAGWAGGFQISAPADKTARTLTVYVGGYQSAGHLRAYLSDGSAEDFVANTQTAGGAYYVTYKLTYTAGQAGQLLYVNWTQGSTNGNVTFAGATLSGGSVTAQPAPAADRRLGIPGHVDGRRRGELERGQRRNQLHDLSLDRGGYAGRGPGVHGVQQLHRYERGYPARLTITASWRATQTARVRSAPR